MRRNRLLFSIMLAAVVLAGLGSRRFAAQLPRFASEYAGDTLYSTAACLCVAILRPGWGTGAAALAGLGFSAAIELTQLYHAEWIDRVRASRPGSWLLGSGFVWRDFACYFLGALLFLAMDAAARFHRA